MCLATKQPCRSYKQVINVLADATPLCKLVDGTDWELSQALITAVCITTWTDERLSRAFALTLAASLGKQLGLCQPEGPFGIVSAALHTLDVKIRLPQSNAPIVLPEEKDAPIVLPEEKDKRIVGILETALVSVGLQPTQGATISGVLKNVAWKMTSSWSWLRVANPCECPPADGDTEVVFGCRDRSSAVYLATHKRTCDPYGQLFRGKSASQ